MAKIVAYKAIDNLGNSYWPEEWPIELLLKWQRNDPVSFASQYLSSPIDLAGNELKREWLNFYDFNNKPEGFEKILAFIDPAVSLSSTADYFVLTVGGLLNQTVYVLDMIRTRAPLEQQLNIIRGAKTLWKVNEIIIEATGQQRYLLQYVQQYAFELFGLEAQFAPIGIPDRQWSMSNKATKFSTLAGHFNSKRILLPGTLNEDDILIPLPKFNVFIDEWITFPEGLHDDTIDSLSGLANELLSGIIAAVVYEPSEAELYNFVQSNISKSSKRKLTPEEEQIIQDYNDNGFYEVRHYGFMNRNLG